MQDYTHLLLERYLGESVVIGDDIIVQLRHIHGKKATLSIKAPATIAIDRLEVRVQKNHSLSSPPY